MTYQSFENLEVWQSSTQLAVDIYYAMKDCKDYSLKDQIQRAAVSVPSNIAEGSERNSNKEFIHFLHISKGSAAELRTQLYIAYKVSIITSQKYDEFLTKLISISKMLFSLINSISAKIK